MGRAKQGMANPWANSGWKAGSAEENASISSVFEQHSRGAWMLALGIVGRLGDAEDVLQESLLKLVQKARKEPIVHPGAYLRAIVRTTALDLLASRRTQQSVKKAASDCQASEQLNDPSELMQAKESVGKLEQAIARLPRRLAKVIIGRDIFLQSYAEIAQDQGISQSTARIYHWQALRQLREILCRD